jgi:hypothetical protein
MQLFSSLEMLVPHDSNGKHESLDYCKQKDSANAVGKDMVNIKLSTLGKDLL